LTLLEICIAAATLAALLTMSAQMMRALGSQQRSLERRGLALRSVQSLAEQVGNTSWEELTQEAVNRLELPPHAVAHLSNADVSGFVHDEPEPVAAKRVTITLQWDDPRGQPVAPARLTTWVFRDDLPLK
jgi:hypothetical protein